MNDITQLSTLYSNAIARADKAEEALRGWQPIETAPIDGTDILVCVTYNLSDDEWETKIWVDWQVPSERWPGYWARIDIPFSPTHWMPLPPPPVRETP